MVYNDADQLTTWPGMHTYTYCNDGSLHQVKNASGTTELASYAYTAAGLLDTATYHDASGNQRTLTNTWDADSNRVSFDANGTQHDLVCDPTAGIPAVIEEVTPTATVRYIREPGGALIARLDATNGIRYYHFDDLGSTRLLTDGDGAITDRYTYDA